MAQIERAYANQSRPIYSPLEHKVRVQRRENDFIRIPADAESHLRGIGRIA